MMKPRQYAQAIIDTKDRAKRKKMLSEVPEIYREWVKKLVTNSFAIASIKK